MKTLTKLKILSGLLTIILAPTSWAIEQCPPPTATYHCIENICEWNTYIDKWGEPEISRSVLDQTHPDPIQAKPTKVATIVTDRQVECLYSDSKTSISYTLSKTIKASYFKYSIFPSNSKNWNVDIKTNRYGEGLTTKYTCKLDNPSQCQWEIIESNS